jgi:DNA (cytosine-5)-methyltransferase 1
MSNISVGSICSGIEAASVAWKDIGYNFLWFSEIADFPTRFLKYKYPTVNNLGNMCDIPSKIANNEIESPDLICGGTPCQAFSLAGWKKGLEDHRGNLTLKFVDIIEENDKQRSLQGKKQTIVFWENVEGVLKDKTNAFGCFLASLAGFDNEISISKWPESGLIHGPKRNIAWRILDAKYFGLPQQRRRLYVLAGGKDYYPENILFEKLNKPLHSLKDYGSKSKTTIISGNKIEIFRNYTDCLYSAYGTKWNGNAAAYNGSLFIVQNDRLRRLTPLECERLMGFPDNYTNIPSVKPTNRYQGVGNSWAVPVIKWIGSRIVEKDTRESAIDLTDFSLVTRKIVTTSQEVVFDLSGDAFRLDNGEYLNASAQPENPTIGNIFNIVDIDAEENFYITPVGCKGILRRKQERKLSINKRLEEVLESISSQWSHEKIEAISRKQNRGRFSTDITLETKACSYSLFD